MLLIWLDGQVCSLSGILHGLRHPLHLLIRKVTQASRVVCEIPATNVGIVRQSDERSRFVLHLSNSENGDYAATRLPFAAAAVMLILTAYAVDREEAMGDKSLKSKQRDQKQKDAAKAGNASAAKSKQDSYNRPQQPVSKGKK